MTTTCAHGRSQGFTLIELLIVISIISVLASMLLPAIGMVKTSSRKAVCGGNLRQIGLSIMTYADDWDGQIMPIQWNYNAMTWGRTLATYLEMNQSISSPRQAGIFNCPEMTWQTRQIMGTGTGVGETSYAGNGYMDERGPLDNRFFFSSIGRWTHSTDLMVAWDGNYYKSDASSNTGCATTTVGMSQIIYAHKAAANVLYADDHVESTQMMNYWGVDADGSAPYYSIAHHVNGRPFFIR